MAILIRHYIGQVLSHQGHFFGVASIGCRNALPSDFGLGGLEWEILREAARIHGGLGGVGFFRKESTMGMDSLNEEDLSLPPLAMQKFQ